MKDWIFLSKNGQDEYINALARSSGVAPTDGNDFDYDSSRSPIVLRGILKHKLIKRCWQDSRAFFFMDTGYFGNQLGSTNPRGIKLYHRIVLNDLQHKEILPRPADRWNRLGLKIHPSRSAGKNILIAAPDEKPCKFYGTTLETWLEQTIEKIKQHTDRPIVIRQRNSNRLERMVTSSLEQALSEDVHALVTFNSNAATEAVLLGYPAFVTAPVHAAIPVTSQDLSKIESPYRPDIDKVHAWARHLAYGQFHVSELHDGTAVRILKELL
jgi:hypothetical protein